MPTTNSLLNSEKRHLPNSFGGSSIVLIIIMLVIVFAIMMSGGASYLFSGNLPSSVSPTPEAPGGGDGGASTSPNASPSISPSQDPNWAIDANLTGCDASGKEPVMKGVATIKGTADGYMTIEVFDGSNYSQVVSNPFSPPSKQYDLALQDSSNFNTQKWRINVFEGNSTTPKATYDGNLTGC